MSMHGYPGAPRPEQPPLAAAPGPGWQSVPAAPAALAASPPQLNPPSPLPAHGATTAARIVSIAALVLVIPGLVVHTLTAIAAASLPLDDVAAAAGLTILGAPVGGFVTLCLAVVGLVLAVRTRRKPVVALALVATGLVVVTVVLALTTVTIAIVRGA